ncbi:MAG: hypothetical protein O9295_22830 [Microcystis sp. LE18-22.4A]|uniref:hypothetical protein n=1 Tax=Microcystis sp. LE18-22.4A TaxID=3016432 RepID=UPI0022BE059E|nr:hypothetical protein [Microcystis sp. LE18-22.4A]MCZ8120799.1 hypothetical protein [Microcystis sp. LE18-22.4A]
MKKYFGFLGFFLLLLWGWSAQAILPNAKEFQVVNDHWHLNQWFSSRDDACRDAQKKHIALNEPYHPGLLNYIYYGPQNSGPWNGMYVGECLYSSVNPWSGESFYSAVMSSRFSAQCPDNSNLVGSGCECNIGFQEDAVAGICRPVRPQMCSAENGLSVGQPIVLTTREKLRSEVDVLGIGANDINLVRTYRSTWAGDKTRGAENMGLIWDHNHRVRLSVYPIESPISVTITFGDGSWMIFEKNTGLNTWRAVNGGDVLAAELDGWVLKKEEDGSTWRFSKAGFLLAKNDINGWRNEYGYDSAGRLALVVNGFGRSLVFKYGGSVGDKLVAVTTSDGRTIGY